MTSERQLTAMALCPDAAGGGLLSVTLVSGPPSEPLLADTAEHKLQDLTPEAVASAVSRIVADIPASTTSIFLLLPVALAWHHTDRYKAAIEALRGVHLWRIASHANPTLVHFTRDFADEEVKVLFLDLTPGHATASLRSVEADEGQVFFSGPMDEPPTTTTASLLSPETVIENLVTPATIHGKIHSIHIFGSRWDPALASALHSKYPETLTRWISLTEISRTATTMIHEHIDVKAEILCGPPLTLLPLQIALADGRLAPVVPRNWYLPLTRTVVLTTSQKSATIRFVNGDKAFGRPVVVDGLAASAKSVARVAVSVTIDDDGAASVSVEEVDGPHSVSLQEVNGASSVVFDEVDGGALVTVKGVDGDVADAPSVRVARVDGASKGVTVVARFGNIFEGLCHEEIAAYVEAHRDEALLNFDQGDVVGALPP